MDAIINVSIAGTKPKQSDKTYQCFFPSNRFYGVCHALSVVPIYFYRQIYKLIVKNKNKCKSFLSQWIDFQEKHASITVYFTVF